MYLGRDGNEAIGERKPTYFINLKDRVQKGQISIKDDTRKRDLGRVQGDW